MSARERPSGQVRATLHGAPIPAAVAAKLANAGGEAPRKRARPIALLFLDVAGCTLLCEALSPRAMNEVVETYFGAYIDAVRWLTSRRAFAL